MVKKNKRSHLVIVIMAFLPYLLYGFQYFPILDDYIQYGCYPIYEKTSHVFFTIGTLSTRPLAGLLDPVLWGRMWPCLWVGLILITTMHVLSAFLFRQVLEKAGYTVGPFFLLIYLLFPLGMEGRFWLSASSRLVTGLFFAALSLFILSSVLPFKEGKTKSKWWFCLFFFLQLISCGFYESVSVFSVMAAVLLTLVSMYQAKENFSNRQNWQLRCIKKYPILLAAPLVSVINIGLMFTYYRVFAGLGAIGSRADQASIEMLWAKAGSLFSQLGEIFSLAYHATIGGSVLGIKLLWNSGVWGLFILFLTAVLCVLLALFNKKRKKKVRAKFIIMEICGLLLFFGPLIPNMLAAEVWLTNRSIFVSLLGMALMAEPLFALFPGRFRQILLGLTAFIFLTATVNEYDVYKRVYEQDTRLLQQVVTEMNAESIAGEKEAHVVLPKEVKTEQNAYYKDHVKSVFDSDWALTGALRATIRSLQPKRIQPLLPGEDYEKENVQTIYVEIK
ncbi:MAG: hypothetical protein E7393_03820 [Ruminococcaceae bacterium]|nr:hypothetical protein [Oscillospiraceae bacterium]